MRVSVYLSQGLRRGRISLPRGGSANLGGRKTPTIHFHGKIVKFFIGVCPATNLSRGEENRWGSGFYTIKSSLKEGRGELVNP